MDRITTSIIASLVIIGVAGFTVLFLVSDKPNQTYAENSIHPLTTIPQTREYTIIVQDTTLEIAPGIRVESWTFNGTIPGPTLRATEGDRVIIHFINESHLPHTIHLHGDHNEVNDGVFQEVLPGNTYTYDFIARPAGALMYHCHVMPVSQHVRNGLYGAFIVDPKEKLEPAREYVIVKGEYDLQDQETPFPDYILFNGYADQYWNNPLLVRTGELVRVYYVDMGAMPAFGFHIHGTIFDVVPSGILENEPIKAQTWEVSPGNAAIFEARWTESGRYLFHLHGIPEEKGTMGYFNVTDASNNAVDGVDVSKTKSIYMWEWEKNLLTSLEKSAPNANVTKTSVETSGHFMHDLLATSNESKIIETTFCEIEKGATLQTSNKSFYPKTIRVNEGDIVKWKNNDSGVHTVTSQDGTFDSGMIMSGYSFESKFEQKGTFDYFCALHPWMKGSVQVI